MGGDWIAYPASAHERLLAEIDRRRADGRLWPGATIAVHKYAAERDAASLAPRPAPDGALAAAELSFGTDPARYDEPLTVVADVPADRDGVVVETAGAPARRAPAVDGRALFDVAPAGRPLSIVVR